ncbi:MAG TPA: hypothetical protein VIV60_24495 [Polyangiaceae bacterium]
MEKKTIARLRLAALIVAIVVPILTLSLSAYTNILKTSPESRSTRLARPAIELCLKMDERRAESPQRDRIFRVVQAFYHGLTTGRFDGCQYFAEQVAKYYKYMNNTTCSAISSYVDGQFLRQYKKVDAEPLDILVTSADTAIVLVHSEFYETWSQQHKEVYSCVRIKWDEDSKLTMLSESDYAHVAEKRPE